MNSRDRLCTDSELRSEILRFLTSLLKDHTGLRALRNRRRDEEIKDKLKNNKPLEDTLRSILNESPTLSALFLPGTRLSDPFGTKKVKTTKKPFIGKRFPTYFRFKDKHQGFVLSRDCHINMRCRLEFETDAENNYFGRESWPGRAQFKQIMPAGPVDVANYVGPTLNDGFANFTFELPSDCKVGQVLEYEIVVDDDTRTQPLENRCKLQVRLPAEHKSGTKTKRKRRTEQDGEDETSPSGITLPNIIEISKEEWDEQDPPFDKFTALRAKHAGESEQSGEGEGSSSGDARQVYDFYVNVDNRYLEIELKPAVNNEQVTKTQFIHGLLLIGLAILHAETEIPNATQDDGEDSAENNGDDVEAKVEQVTRAVAPFILPMITSLGMLEPELASDSPNTVEEAA